MLKSFANGLLSVLDVAVVEVLVLSEILVLGGGGGPCICCIIVAKILWALERSPDERASSKELKSFAIGLVSVLDVDDEDELVLSVVEFRD